MFTVLACLSGSHDRRLVLLALAVCLFAAFTAVSQLRTLLAGRARRPAGRLAVAAAVTGIGVWATHFIAMLAFDPLVPSAYDVGLTLLSLVAAIGLIAFAFAAVLRTDLRAAPAVGGAILGLAVAVMHYIGMAAFHVAGRVLWDPAIVAASVIIGMGLGVAAMMVAKRPEGGWLRHSAAALLLTGAICGMHFTAMGAAAVLPDPTISVLDGSLPPQGLAVWVGAAALGLLLLSAFSRHTQVNHRRAESRRRRDLANISVEGLVVCDQGRIVSANESFADLAGRPEAALIGTLFADLFDEPSVGERLAAAGARAQGECRFEARLRSAGGEPVAVKLIARMIAFGGRSQQGIAVRDLRERYRADAQIRYLAHHDPLTGLANRASFNAQLDGHIERHRRQDDAFAILCLDLDRFKQINDVFGHAAGDAVLTAISQRISATLDEGDVLARLGGDEFAIIRLGPSRPADLSDLAERILAAVSPEVSFDGGIGAVGVSIGIARYPQDGQAATAVLGNADAALYSAKGDGRGVYRFFDPEIGDDLRTRRGLEVDLRQAIARGELSVAYQPQATLKTGDIFGFEALARWTHPQRGPVEPTIFIRVAEETGLILSIGEWVLRQACAEAATWSRPLQIAVNISAVQLHAADLPTLVARILEETGLAPERLELEITETALVRDLDRALSVLNRIKDLGVKVAMDDFGSGYSSLANLRAFPFDKIKIDRSFIRNVHRDEDAATIVRSIVGMARGLKLTVLAEGVETAEELAFLGDELCAEAQGYLVGRPGAMTSFAAAFADTPAESLAKQRLKRLA